GERLITVVRPGFLVPISIHAPREGSDGDSVSADVLGSLFLSTLPVRGATFALLRFWQTGRISIHAPREGSDHSSSARCLAIKLFLSTLPVRGATPGPFPKRRNYIFLSTLPVRGATYVPGSNGKPATISIHAPREGSDRLLRQFQIPGYYFYPRSP